MINALNSVSGRLSHVTGSVKAQRFQGNGTDRVLRAWTTWVRVPVVQHTGCADANKLMWSLYASTPDRENALYEC